MTAGLHLEEENGGERVAGIAICYGVFSGIVGAAAFLLMKFVVALQSLGTVLPPGL
jgi:hypothetical protein